MDIKRQTRTERMQLRMFPKIKRMAEIAARKKRISVASYVEELIKRDNKVKRINHETD